MCRTQPFVGVLEERPEVVEVGRGVAHDALGAVGARGMILITSDRLKKTLKLQIWKGEYDD